MQTVFGVRWALLDLDDVSRLEDDRVIRFRRPSPGWVGSEVPDKRDPPTDFLSSAHPDPITEPGDFPSRQFLGGVKEQFHDAADRCVVAG